MVHSARYEVFWRPLRNFVAGAMIIFGGRQKLEEYRLSPSPNGTSPQFQRHFTPEDDVRTTAKLRPFDAHF